MKSLFALIIICFTAGKALGQDDLLNETVEGHTKLINSYKTVSCDVEKRMLYPNNQIISSGRYLRNGDLVVVHLGNEILGMDHFSVKGGEVRGVGRSRWEAGEPTSFNAFRWPISQSIIQCDVWDEMLLNFPIPSGPKGSMSELVKSLKNKPNCEKVLKDGLNLLELKVEQVFNGKKLFFKYLIDTNKNYLVVERETRYEKNSEYVMCKIVEFKQLSNGIIFPIKEIRSFYNNGKKTQERTTEIKNLFVNSSIDPEFLTLPEIPHGTLLTDEIEGRRGYVDSSWKWIKKIGPSGGTQTIPLVETGTDIVGQQSVNEPWEYGNMFLLTGCGFLVLVGVYLFFKNYRS